MQNAQALTPAPMPVRTQGSACQLGHRSRGDVLPALVPETMLPAQVGEGGIVGAKVRGGTLAVVVVVGAGAY